LTNTEAAGLLTSFVLEAHGYEFAAGAVGLRVCYREQAGADLIRAKYNGQIGVPLISVQ
jgi:hypothetical protein